MKRGYNVSFVRTIYIEIEDGEDVIREAAIQLNDGCADEPMFYEGDFLSMDHVADLD